MSPGDGPNSPGISDSPGAGIAVLINPAASRGRAVGTAAAAVRALRDRGIEPVIYQGASAAETVELAAKAVAAEPELLLAVGGDGLIAAALGAITAARAERPGAISPALGVIPAGTGNDLARALQIPRDDPAAAVTLALSSPGFAFDVGEITTADGVVHPFATVAAVGFDSIVSDRVNRLRWPTGKARYYLALAIELAALAPIPIRHRADGGPEAELHGLLIAIGNTSSYGGGMQITPAAVPTDGVFDVTLIDAAPRRKLAVLFPTLLRGTHVRHRGVRTARAREFWIDAPGITVYADGEPCGETPATFVIRPGAVTLRGVAPTGLD